MTKSTLERYDHNPFVESLLVPVTNKQVRVSRIGKDEQVLLNTTTGETSGTHVVTHKKVDAAQFVKLFTANIALTFELKAAGIKAFNILVWILQNKTIDKDLLPLDRFALEDFLVAHPSLKLSRSTFLRGLSDLENAKIIAKNVRLGWYYVNPNFIFNGDRIAFTTIIEKEKRERVGEVDEQ